MSDRAIALSIGLYRLRSRLFGMTPIRKRPSSALLAAKPASHLLGATTVRFCRFHALRFRANTQCERSRSRLDPSIGQWPQALTNRSQPPS